MAKTSLARGSGLAAIAATAAACALETSTGTDAAPVTRDAAVLPELRAAVETAGLRESLSGEVPLVALDAAADRLRDPDNRDRLVAFLTIQAREAR